MSPDSQQPDVSRVVLSPKHWRGQSQNESVVSVYKKLQALAGILLKSRIVEASIIYSVSITFYLLRIVDGILHTRLRHGLAKIMNDISRDSLSIIRIAQIRYLFRHQYGLSKIKVRLASGSYWMSIPCIISGIDRSTGVEKKFLGKIINDRSALKHKYMTRFRNLGAYVTGTDFVFDGHEGARDMIEFERDSLVRLKMQNVNAPEIYGIHKLNFEDYILVMEYLDGEPLSEVGIDGEIAELVFRTLKIMHDNGVFHGDIKLDNFLYSGGRIAVVDCLKINNNDLHRSQDFDLICAICALAQRAPVEMVIDKARKYHTEEELERSVQLIGLALNKIDMELPAGKIGEIIDRLGGK